jgi:hypothetical protein
MKKSQNMLVWLMKIVLAQHHFTISLGWLVKATAMLSTCRKESNK